jgi:hypothetical protein
MLNALAWIALLTAGAVVVIAPLLIMLLYKVHKENPKAKLKELNT